MARKKAAKSDADHEDEVTEAAEEAQPTLRTFEVDSSGPGPLVRAVLKDQEERRQR